MRQYEVRVGGKHNNLISKLDELWRYRELIYIFAWRDIKVKYKQTYLGVAWVVFQPLVSMLIFTTFFGKLANIPSNGLPYPVFVLSGLILWSFFSNSLSQASNSFIDNENIIKKNYFPRIVLPLASIISNVPDFIVNFIMMIAILFIFKITPSYWIVLALIFSIILTIITAFGASLFLASLNVRYRDVRYIMPFFIQVLMFLTPVIYPLGIVSPQNRIIMALNPMTSTIEALRLTLIKQGSFDMTLISISTLVAIISLVVGYLYFNRTERTFADIV